MCRKWGLCDFGQGVIAASRVINGVAAPKHGQKRCEMCQEAALLPKQYEKAQCMSSNVCRQNVSLADFFAECLVGFFCFCVGFFCAFVAVLFCVFVYFCI